MTLISFPGHSAEHMGLGGAIAGAISLKLPLPLVADELS